MSDDIDDLAQQVAILLSRLDMLESDLLTKADDYPEGDVVVNEEAETPITVQGYSLADFAFGCSFSGTTVTVLGGYVRRGFRAPVYVAGASFGLAGVRWSYVTYNLQSGAASLTTNASSIPDDTATETYIALHRYQLVSGLACVTSGGVHHIGDIFLPGETA